MRKKQEIYCNCCGRRLNIQDGVLIEDVLSVHKEWGYFSNKDGMVQNFDVCEACLKKITDQFVIPVEEIQKTELLQEQSAY